MIQQNPLDEVANEFRKTANQIKETFTSFADRFESLENRVCILEQQLQGMRNELNMFKPIGPTIDNRFELPSFDKEELKKLQEDLLKDLEEFKLKP